MKIGIAMEQHMKPENGQMPKLKMEVCGYGYHAMPIK